MSDVRHSHRARPSERSRRGPRRRVRILVVLGLVAVIAAGVLFGRQGRGPLSAVLCPLQETHYDQVPHPAPRLFESERLPAGGQVSIARYGAELPPYDPPELEGDIDAVTMESQVIPTAQRCDRVLSGYRMYVLTARRAVTVALSSYDRIVVTAAAPD